MPVALAAAPNVAAGSSLTGSPPPAVIELTVGKSQLRIDGAVDVALLSLVLQRLLT